MSLSNLSVAFSNISLHPVHFSSFFHFAMSDANAIKCFCRRCEAHSINMAMHTSYPFKFCKCDQCEKITNDNEIAKERASKQRADATPVPSAAST